MISIYSAKFWILVGIVGFAVIAFDPVLKLLFSLGNPWEEGRHQLIENYPNATYLVVGSENFAKVENGRAEEFRSERYLLLDRGIIVAARRENFGKIEFEVVAQSLRNFWLERAVGITGLLVIGYAYYVRYGTKRNAQQVAAGNVR
jgi:hypothetical protein